MSLPDLILEERVVPVARGLDGTNAPGMAEALLRGGIHSIEITVEGGGGFDAIAAVADVGIIPGAGTVVSIDQASRAVAAGAQFLVSPHLDAELLDWAAGNAVPMIPGGLTPTEIATAWRHHPPAVKVFPADVGGPGYLRSLRGPYPDLRLIPTGGVDDTNARAYLDAGAVAVGVGGWLTGVGDLGEVTRRARLLRETIS